MNSQGTPHTSGRFRAWSAYLSRIVHPSASKSSLQQAMPTRRQSLLAAQEQKKREHRVHVLELLREVKEKNQQHPYA